MSECMNFDSSEREEKILFKPQGSPSFSIYKVPLKGVCGGDPDMFSFSLSSSLD